MNKFNVLVVDDEPNILLSIESCLPPNKYQVSCFSTARDAFFAIQHNMYDCAIIDIRLGSESGLDLFKQMQNSDIQVPTIFMSGNATLDEAAESQKLGAYDFIEKPFSSDKLRITLDNCIDFYRLKNKLSHLEKNNLRHSLIGEHKLVLELKTQIERVAKTDAVVLVHGESGTGKELIARAVHSLSSRSSRELVTVNCSAIPENLIESALFGHTKGAFTGADRAKKGYFEQAHQSTLFLDEIADMPLSAQANLLRVLENKEIQKVGAESAISVDVRVIAASHKDLKKEVEQGRFREDLFYRINVVPLYSPPLRERTSDLGILVQYLVTNLCKRHGLPEKKVDNRCINVFEKYAWPGNVRELTNTLERMIIMSGETLLESDIPKDILQSQLMIKNDHSHEHLSLKEYRERCERELIVERLKHLNGNISKVAESLNIDRTHLHKKLRQYEIQKEQLFN